MRYILVIALILIIGRAYPQALRDINFNYLYSAAANFQFDIKPVKTSTGWEVFFKLQLDSVSDINDYAVQWELRQALSAKEGTPLASIDQSSWKQERQTLSGRIFLQDPPAQEILLAKVVKNSSRQLWMFYTFLRPNYPLNAYLEDAKGEIEFSSYADGEKLYQVGGVAQSVVVSFFSETFPAAAPAFSEGLARVPSIMKSDSLFTITAGQQVQFSKPGLYLIQSDTTSQQGLAFRVENDYPKYQRVENLTEPLVYITTKQEYERLKLANGEKKAFDRVILSITRDAERARDFMRSYFRRVEAANKLFTSYKEGWKTDRGMIYIIFGFPDEVYKFNDREVWQYSNSQFKLTFNFVRTGTLFDPENYVLVRDNKYQETWYQVIDLWRNARF